MKRNAWLIVLLSTLALSGCATPEPPIIKPLEVKPAQLPEVPADVMVERKPDFRQRVLEFFHQKPASSSLTSPINVTR